MILLDLGTDLCLLVASVECRFKDRAVFGVRVALRTNMFIERVLRIHLCLSYVSHCGLTSVCRTCCTEESPLFDVQIVLRSHFCFWNVFTEDSLLFVEHGVLRAHLCLSNVLYCGRRITRRRGRMWMKTRRTHGAIECVCGDRK